jgi:hemoglobin
MERIVTADVRIDEKQLGALVDRFYGRVRADPMLGPLFNQAVRDWPEHLSKLADFWSSVMLTSGRYKGNPMAAHLKHQARITPAMFERWLALWAETTTDMMPWAADELQAKAARIAASLQLALFFRPDSAARIVRPSQGVCAA